MTNFSTPVDALAHKAITWNYGNFITLVINFVIVAFCIFLVVKAVNKMKRPDPKRRAGVKRLSGVRDDYSHQSDALSSLHKLNFRSLLRIDAVACYFPRPTLPVAPVFLGNSFKNRLPLSASAAIEGARRRCLDALT